MRILVAEDDVVLRLMLDGLLRKWGYEVHHAENGVHAWETLRGEDPPRLALLDWMMPGMDGVEICRRIRRRVSPAYTYILLLTAKVDQGAVVEGLEAGADDYLRKPFHPAELQARLHTGHRILKLEDDLVAARDALQYKATHDGLTGLWNRAAILDFLRRELSRASREHVSLGILLGDLDHFKHVNDAFGHLAGDEVLRQTASRMLEHIRPYDGIGRYGGEEFLVVLPGCDAKSAAEKGEQFRAAIADSPMEAADISIASTMSLGAASTEGRAHATLEEMLHEADMALYRAKEAGRNRVILAAPAGEKRLPPEPEAVPVQAE